MAEKVPIRAAYDGSDACGLSELQDGEVVGVEHGGLGVCTLTTHGVLLGNTQGSVQVSGALTTNGQILIGGTSGPSVAGITGTSNEVEITAGDGSLQIGLPSAVSGLTTVSSTNLCATTLLNTAGLCVNSAYSFPTSDGTAGYIFCTDGSGSISFAANDGKLTIADEGSALASRQCLNFIGAAVTATDNSGTNATDVTVCATTASIGLRETDGTQCCVTLSSATVGELLCVDGSPQLGGNLDVTGHSLITTSNNNMTFCPHGSGKIILDNLCWPTADGSAGQIICTDGSGGLSFADDAGGSPGGSNTQIQFNNSSAFGGSSDLTWDGSVLKTTSVCTTGNTIIGGDLTIAGDDLTMGTNTSGYIMVADGTNYNPVAVSGDVSINAAGAVTIAATSVENSMLAGSIANAKLSNSTVSYGGVSLSLGGSDGTPAFDLTDATNYPTSSLVGTITNAQLAGSIVNAKLVNDSVSFGGVSVDLGASDGTPAFDLSDATAYAGDSSLVTVGTISSGSWQGTAVASGYIAGTLTGKTLTSPVLNGTLSGTAFLDEDNMASNSAIAAASQQSIKAYVDSVASGLDLKDSVHVSTTAALSADYSNGSSGVGATLTNNSTQEALSIDGQTLATSERVLVKDQSTASQNGIYSVTTAGDGSTNWVLTRTTDFDTPTEVTSGAFTFVETGSSNADSGWVMTTDGSVTIGTTSLAWSQFSGAGQITAGAGMTKSGNTLNVIAGDNITVNANDVALSTTITGLTALTSTTLTGTLATAAQANITSLGTLSSLDVSGDLTIDTTSLAVDSSNNRVGIGTATPSHLLDVDGVANIATCVITPVVCINSEYALPSSDGTAGQIVCTDGSGATTFADAASSGHTISEEGSVLASRTCLNFIGAAVTAADNSGTNATDVTVCATNALFGIRAADGTACCITLSNAAIGESLVSDTTPQLGGNLDVNGNSIVSASNGNIPITPNGSGIVIIDGLCHPTADGSAGQILCTDGSAALKFATASAGVTLAGSTNNTIATVTGSDALCGEANLRFDGSKLEIGAAATVSSSADGFVINDGANAGMTIYSTGTSSGQMKLSLTNAEGADAGAALIYSNSADALIFNVNGATEALRINNEGVLGIKTTPTSGWHTDHGVLQIGTGALWVDPHDETAASNMLFLSNNLYRDSADEWRHIVTDEATRYYQYNGVHYFDTAPSGSAGAAASFTNRVKIDNNGKMSLNTSSPSLASAIFIKQASSDAAGGIILQHPDAGIEDSAAIYYESSDGSLRIAQATDASGADATSDFTDTVVFTQGGLLHIGDSDAPSDYLDVSINSGGGRPARFTQKASNGNILALEYSAVSPDNNTQNFLVTSDSTAIRNYIYSDGDVWTADAGTLTSDERLKTNIVDASDKLADLMQLQVRNYEWTPEYHPTKVGEKKIGFIAQELETVFPALVSEHDIAPDNAIMEQLYDANDDIPAGKAIGDVKVAAKDHEPTMRKAYKDAFTPILVKALQEVTTRLEAAEAKIAELESA